MKETYEGSCHCGSIRFKCAIDLAPAEQRSTPERPGVWWTTTFRCNCSYCVKTRFWKGFVAAPDFAWISGKETSGVYQFAAREIEHFFCKVCGAHPFARSTLEQLGGEFYCVNIACLDGISDDVLANAPITYEDGRRDEWGRAPQETRHL